MTYAHTQPDLPAGLGEIADHAGREAALTIALEHGGQSWRVPARADHPEGQALTALLGRDAAQALIAGCGGHVMEVPLARRAVVAWLAGRGVHAPQIASLLRISRRTARRYIRETRSKHRTQRDMRDEHPHKEQRATLLARIAKTERAEEITEMVTTALIETGADVDIPQTARGVVEIQLYGRVAHGADLAAACLVWAQAAREDTARQPGEGGGPDVG